MGKLMKWMAPYRWTLDCQHRGNRWRRTVVDHAHAHHTKTAADLPDGFDKSATFRIDPPKNGQSTGVHFAEDYKRVP